MLFFFTFSFLRRLFHFFFDDKRKKEIHPVFFYSINTMHVNRFGGCLQNLIVCKCGTGGVQIGDVNRREQICLGGRNSRKATAKAQARTEAASIRRKQMRFSYWKNRSNTGRHIQTVMMNCRRHLFCPEYLNILFFYFILFSFIYFLFFVFYLNFKDF